MIPETAIQAAAKELARQDLPDGHTLEDALLAQEKWRRRAYHAEQILSAALPHIETALRAQIAADIRALKTKADLMSATDLKRNSAIDDAARIAEEGNTK